MIETLGTTGLVLVYALFWLVPFFIVLKHLAKIKRPFLMKFFWTILILGTGLFGVLIYMFVVYWPEKRKEKLNETKKEIK